MADLTFPERLTLQLPLHSIAALKLLARRESRTRSDLARRAIVDMLEAAGLSLGPFEDHRRTPCRRSAGTRPREAIG